MNTAYDAIGQSHGEPSPTPDLFKILQLRPTPTCSLRTPRSNFVHIGKRAVGLSTERLFVSFSDSFMLERK